MQHSEFFFTSLWAQLLIIPEVMLKYNVDYENDRPFLRDDNVTCRKIFMVTLIRCLQSCVGQFARRLRCDGNILIHTRIIYRHVSYRQFMACSWNFIERALNKWAVKTFDKLFIRIRPLVNVHRSRRKKGYVKITRSLCKVRLCRV